LARQQTIAEEVTCQGIGLHGGVAATVCLRSAEPGTGIVFRRLVDGRSHLIPADAQHIRSASYATTLGGDGECPGVATVEHLLAALWALDIDNVEVEVDGPEVPVMDGSAQPFVDLIRQAGTRTQPERRPEIRVLRGIEVADEGRRIAIEPASCFGIDYTVDFAHPVIGRQSLSIPILTAAAFERELSRARTFGFLADVERLRRAGLAAGGSLDNTVVLDEHGVMNPEGLRWPDEFVRHKALDLVGDLALLGVRLRGRVHVECGGHALHHRLVAALLEQRDAWVLEGVPARLRSTPRLDLAQDLASRSRGI
jgi:UDP-3-O-[3-hydroxymyristoyl] N-acetylglucosamine deacetylase